VGPKLVAVYDKRKVIMDSQVKEETVSPGCTLAVIIMVFLFKYCGLVIDIISTLFSQLLLQIPPMVLAITFLLNLSLCLHSIKFKNVCKRV